MAYRVSRDAAGVPGITLAGEPAYCHALDAGVPAGQAQLRDGLWLVMAFAAWSAPDVAAVQDAIDLARRLGGRLHLGLRPYDDPAELEALWPGAGDAPGPFWLLARDGAVLQSRAGQVGPGELERWVRAAEAG